MSRSRDPPRGRRHLAHQNSLHDSTIGRLQSAEFTPLPRSPTKPLISVSPHLGSHASSQPASRRSSPAKNTPPTSIAFLDENTDDENDTHFSLQKTIQPSKYSHLLQLRPKLDGTNYTIWSTNVYRALETVGLHVYLTENFSQPTDDDGPDGHRMAIRWAKANGFVASVLTSCMDEEVMAQVSHISMASRIYTEIHQLYAETTATDWTLSITSLVTTRYSDGDVNSHIAKMKGFRRDIILMNRDIGDELFACFLRISMPSSWNYVFSDLSDHYTSADVEQRIRNEHSIRSTQTGTSSTSYRAAKTSRSGLSKIPIPGQPYCNYCEVVGHWEPDCRTKRWNERRDKDKDKDRDRDKLKSKPKPKPKPKHDKRANQVAAEEKEEDDSSDEPSRSEAELSSYLTTNSTRSRFGWILDGGSNHVRTERPAFTTDSRDRYHVSDSRKGLRT